MDERRSVRGPARMPVTPTLLTDPAPRLGPGGPTGAANRDVFQLAVTASVWSHQMLDEVPAHA